MKDKIKHLRERLALFIYPEMLRQNKYYKNKMKQIRKSDKYIVIQPHIDLKGLAKNAYIEGNDVLIRDTEMNDLTLYTDSTHLDGAISLSLMKIDGKNI